MMQRFPKFPGLPRLPRLPRLSKLSGLIPVLAMFSIGLLFPLAASQAQSDDVFEQSYEFGPGVTVRVDNPSGKIGVEVWGEDLVHIVANKAGGVRQGVLPSEIAIMRTRTQVTITCTPRVGSQLDLKVYVPRRSHLRLQSTAASVEILGPVASATAETQSGDILMEVPSSQDAEMGMHSTNGSVSSSLNFSAYDVNTPHHMQGKLGQGGSPIVLRSTSGSVIVQPLRPQLAALMTRDQPTQNQAGPDNQGYSSAYPSGGTGNAGASRPQRPATAWPDPDPNSTPANPSNRGNGGNTTYTDVFGANQNTQGSTHSTEQGGLGSRNQRNDSNLGTSGGFGVRIIPPPTSPGPATTPAADDALRNSDSSAYGSGNRGNGGGSLHGRSSTSAADDALASIPKRDPAASSGPHPPRIVRRGDDGSPLPSSNKDNGDDDSSADAIKVDSKLVNLNINASSRSGRSLTDLQKSDFTVYEDDVKQEVAHFVPVATPFNLVLVLDLSGSTREKIDSIKQTALKFISVTDPQDKVAVVTFTRGVRVVCRPTSDRELLKKRIREISRTDGGTAFYEAMWFVLIDVLREIQGERNAIVVMTDGVDNAMSAAYPAPSRVSFKQMLDKILESGTLVYPIYLDTEPENYQQQWGETPEVYAQARTQLQQLADASGGVLFMSPRVEDLGNIYEKVAAELRTIYSLGYYPTNLERDGKWHKIRVKVSRDDVVTRTRRGYYAK